MNRPRRNLARTLRAYQRTMDTLQKILLRVALQRPIPEHLRVPNYPASKPE